MSIWAIVPVKPFSQAKSRLQSLLSPEERSALGRQFLIHTLDVLMQVRDISQVLVVSRDSAALTLARAHQARAVTEAGAPNLNSALWRATQAALSLGAHAVTVLPTDLPYLSADAVQQLVTEPGDYPAVVIAPDRREAGTNALFMRPPGLIQYAFGPNSFRVHQAQAERAGARLRIYRSLGTDLDVDVPEDWELYQARRLENSFLTHP